MCSVPCSILLPSSRHPARRALRHPYHSRIIHHRRRARIHRQLILQYPLRLCNHMLAVYAGQTLSTVRHIFYLYCRQSRDFCQRVGGVSRITSTSGAVIHEEFSSLGISQTRKPLSEKGRWKGKKRNAMFASTKMALAMCPYLCGRSCRRSRYALRKGILSNFWNNQ